MVNQNRPGFPVALLYRVIFFTAAGALLWWGMGTGNLMRALIMTATVFILSEAGIRFYTRRREVPDSIDPVEDEDFGALSSSGASDHKSHAIQSHEPKLLPNPGLAEQQQEDQKNRDQEIEFFEKILNSASLYSFIVISMDGKVKLWNSGAEFLFGWNKEEIMGKPVSLTFIKDESGKAAQIQRQRSKQVMKEGKAIFNMTRRRKSGEQFPMHCTVTALKDEKGKVEAFLEIGRDLTIDLKKDKTLKEQIQTAGSLAKNLKKIEGVVKSIEMITLQTNILALNAAVEAARAGDAGAGFSVISGEMRTLSNNSSKSAQEIGLLVEEIRRESRKITETKIEWIEIE